MTTEILLAGFGGQGILFSGKLMAYQGLIENKQISWLPSYGPEMRGGTANCSVIISDEPVGSPIVSKPDCLIVMNLPSLDKYEGEVKPGGCIIADSTLIERKINREDVRVFAVPATRMATEMGTPTLANMILFGKFVKETGVISAEQIEPALKKVIPAKHADMLEVNLKAIRAGLNF